METPLLTLQYHLSSMPLPASFLYLAGIWGLYKLMQPRAAVSIPKPVLVLYNVAQCVINGYVAYLIADALSGRVWGIGQPETEYVRYGVYLHYLCKVSAGRSVAESLGTSEGGLAPADATPGPRRTRSSALGHARAPGLADSSARVRSTWTASTRSSSPCGRRTSSCRSCTCGTTRRS